MLSPARCADRQSQRRRPAAAFRPYPFGGPIPLLFAFGEPEHRGRQIGEQLQAFSPGLVAALTAGKLDNYLPKGPRESMNGRARLLAQAESFMDLMRSRMGAEVVTEYLSELNGVADGAGVDRWDLWFTNLGDYFEVWQRQTEVRTPRADAQSTSTDTGRCSAVAAWGTATAHGSTVIGHNCDGPRFVAGMLPHVLTVIAPEKGNPVISGAPATNWGGHHICSDRIFVCGTALLGYSANKRNLGVIGGPHGIVRRWICQYANDRHEALRMQQGLGGVGEQGGMWPASSGVGFADAQGAVFVQGTADELAVLTELGRHLSAAKQHSRSDQASGTCGSSGSRNS